MVADYEKQELPHWAAAPARVIPALREKNSALFNINNSKICNHSQIEIYYVLTIFASLRIFFPVKKVDNNAQCTLSREF
jgi:hypothetical protein